LIRQFYSIVRTFRIDGANGAYNYIDYSNANIVPQILPAAASGMQAGTRVPIFDIKVKPQRSNPFNRMAHNELAKELYGAGFFDPNRADQALIALSMMDFEGKEEIIDKINKNKTLLAMLNQLLSMLGTSDPNAVGGMGMPGIRMPEGTNSQNSGGMDGAAENATTSYGEKLAKRAKVAVE
jgi:hypothetical protein